MSDKVVSTRRLRKPGVVGVTLARVTQVVDKSGETVEEIFNGIASTAEAVGFQAKSFRLDSALEYMELHTEAYKRMQELKYPDDEIEAYLGKLK